MTVDASRSCLGLGTCVGSVTRQIVDARVLLTATAPPALPGSSVSEALLAPPVDAITSFPQSASPHRHLPGNGPDEARQLAGDRSGDDISRLAGPREPAIARTQSTCPFQAISRIGLGWFSCRNNNSRLIRAGKR